MCVFNLVPLDGNLFCSYGSVGVGKISMDSITLGDLQDFLLNAKDRLPLCIRFRKRGLKLLVGSYQSLHTMDYNGFLFVCFIKVWGKIFVKGIFIR